jgi:serine/threonine protein kinase
MELERLGPYRIVGKLGRGGMGTVFEAVHEETGEAAAVKLLSAALAEEEGFRSRFEIEIETLRKLNHPNIVRLFGFGEENGRLFYAMELVDGNSLEEALRQGQRFTWREAVQIGIETCRALRHAHDRGVIHRDIKPGNLLLTADNRVKLSDFGIARLFGRSHLTCAGNVLGTAEYMSPEQAEGRPVDSRADLYSLGALLYTLLAGRPIFHGKSLPEMLHKQRFEQPEPIRKHAPDVPEELERILSQLLEKEPERRIPNADVLARRLEAMLDSFKPSGATLDADPNWFETESPKGSAQPGDAIPETLDLGVRGSRPPLPPSPVFPPTILPNGIGDEKSTPDAAPPSHFVVVGEEELDAQEEERPPVISWQTWMLVAALVALAAIFWLSLLQPKADTLYRRIEAKTVDGSPKSILAAEEDIRSFLDNYSTDSRAAKLQGYQKEIELNQYRIKLGFDLPTTQLDTKRLTPIERDYREALSYLRLDADRGMAKLQAMVELYGSKSGKLGEEEPCVTLARRKLAELKKETEKYVAKQLATLKSRLADADALRSSDDKQNQAKAISIYRAIIELYAEKPWAADVVRQARDGLEKGRP